MHDEFSYLLGAETFLSGRLTNPTPAEWVFFETFQVNLTPSYSSKYPPGPALVMALGWLVFGHPWAGVLLSFAGMGAALWWMLRGWGPPWSATIWSLGFGLQLMFVAQWGHVIGGHWINSYWGGALAAASGALAIGASIRLRRKLTTGPAAVGAAGAGGLLLTRPLEGLVVCALCLLLTFRWRAPGRRGWFSFRPIAAAAVVLAVFGGFLLTHNKAVTGRYTVLPYQVYYKTYAMAPPFWFAPPEPVKVYRHKALDDIWNVSEMDAYRVVRAHPWAIPLEILWFIGPMFVSPAWLPALFGALTGRARKTVLVTHALLLFLLFFSLYRLLLAHYAAPAAGLLVLLLAFGHRGLRARLRGKRFGPAAADLALCAGFALAVAGMVVLQGGVDRPSWFAFSRQRAAMEKTLEAAGGRHLVIVRYGPEHYAHDEWVYNRASFDQAPVLWARDMGDENNRALLAAYPCRQVWLFQPDRAGAVPVRLPAGIAPRE